MKPYFTTKEVFCEECSNQIYNNYEFIRYEDLNFCQDSCLTDWMLKQNTVKILCLTDKEVYD